MVPFHRRKPPKPAFRTGDEWDPGNPQNRERTRTLQTDLRERLLRWDPIGIADAPEARDEYDCMISPLLHKLHGGESAKALARWLSGEQRDHFGLSPDKEAADRLAAELVAWWKAKTTAS